MVSTWMSIPSLSMSAMRSSPSARPPACRSNGVPLTTSATPSTVQCEWTSMTVTRWPPMEIRLRTTGPAGAAPPRPPRPPPPPRCAHAGSSRPATYAPAAAPATVLKKSLRFCMSIPFVFFVSFVVAVRPSWSRRRARRHFQQLHDRPAEDLFLLRVVQERRVQHEVHVHRPRERRVGAVDELPRAHLRD